MSAALPLHAQELEPFLEDRSTLLSNPAPMLPGSSAPQIEGITLFPDEIDAESALIDLHDQRPWKFVFHGSARADYTSNIFIQHENEEEDFAFTIAPGVAFGYGDFKSEIFGLATIRERFESDRSGILEEKNYFFLNYIPSYTAFFDHTEESTFDHDVALEGRYRIHKLTAGVKLRFQTLNVPDVDLGERIEQERFTGQITTAYDYTDKTSFELNGFAFTRNYDERINIHEYRVQSWLNYLVQPKINLSAGLTYGHVDVSSGPSQDYEQVLLRARYLATQKLHLNATAGVEYRQIESFEDQTNAVFTAGGSYQPSDGSTLHLQTYRRNQTSATAGGMNYMVTGIDLRWQQRFLQRYYFGLGGGFQTADYDTQTSSEAGREDDTLYVRQSVGFDLTKWMTAELGAEYRKNNSSVEIRSFAEASAYLQLNVLF